MKPCLHHDLKKNGRGPRAAAQSTRSLQKHKFSTLRGQPSQTTGQGPGLGETLCGQKVCAFAEYLGCDPQLAQELKTICRIVYFELRSFKKLDRWGSLDGR